MSPRAAWRLEALGFEDVFDYVPGKVDWLAHGLPSEGTLAAEPTAGDLARRDVPTCAPDEELADVRLRVRDTGWNICIVVNERNIVLGRLGRAALGSDDRGRVEDAMTEGPSTIRPHKPLREITERLRDRSLTSALVTAADGRLVGVVRLEEAERRLAQ